LALNKVGRLTESLSEGAAIKERRGQLDSSVVGLGVLALDLALDHRDVVQVSTGRLLAEHLTNCISNLNSNSQFTYAILPLRIKSQFHNR
jgi:hypothetical protein